LTSGLDMGYNQPEGTLIIAFRLIIEYKEPIMNRIIGRENEIKELTEIYESDEPQFLAVYGRRRIGKTFLISNFFNDKGLYFELTGIHNASLKLQLQNFSYAYAEVFDKGKVDKVPISWFEAFQMLRKRIESLNTDKKCIIFIDEIPWLATKKSDFLYSLDHAWNRYFSRMNNIILIICGSAASWIINNIINDKGGLHGRVTKQIRLLPFSLKETETYLKSKNIGLDKKQLIELYMAIGGVAGYLNYIRPGLSAAQNINDICFSSTGQLVSEFNKLYRSLFDNYELHISIIKTLAKSHYGLSRSRLLDESKLSKGGTATKILNELIEAGFIAKMPDFKQNSKEVRYKLIDEYSMFDKGTVGQCCQLKVNSVSNLLGTSS
jgi:AAA+ ATPase superfamily predicted ATPase